MDDSSSRYRATKAYTHTTIKVHDDNMKYVRVHRSKSDIAHRYFKRLTRTPQRYHIILVTLGLFSTRKTGLASKVELDGIYR